jgi:glycolate oxidase FAD binding subunit
VHDDSDPGGPAGARDLLFVRLRGAVAAVEAACTTMLAEVQGERMDTLQAAADWELCRNQQLPFFTQAHRPGMVLWRVSVAQTAPVLDLPGTPLVEWHGGLRWLWAPPEAAAHLQAQARTAGGFATQFIAASARYTGATGQFGTQNTAEAAIAQRLKASFDPQGIFNVGRLFAEF